MQRSIAALTALAVLAAPLGAMAAPGDLPSDPVERSALCAAAVGANGATAGSSPEFAKVDRMAHLAFIGSGGSPEGMTKVKTALGTVTETLSADMSKVPVIAAACDRAYPQTLSSAPLRLPKDPVDRGLGCLVMSAYMVGFYKGFEANAVYPEAARYQRLLDVMGPKLDQMLPAAGITTQEAAEKKVWQIAATAGDYGPPTKLADACLKEFGA